MPSSFASSVSDNIVQQELVEIWSGGLTSWLEGKGLDVSGRSFIDFIAFPVVGKCSYSQFTTSQSYYNDSLSPWAESLTKLLDGWLRLLTL